MCLILKLQEKILRSVLKRFQIKVIAIEDNNDVVTLKLDEFGENL